MKICRKIFEVDDNEMKTIKTVRGNLYMKRLIREPAGHVTVEDFASGDTVTWSFHHTEIHYVIKGKAEVKYSMPPLHLKEESTTVEKGDIYMIYSGEQITWKVISDEPYRHLCIIMPAIPVPSGDHLVEEHYAKFQSDRMSNP